VGDAFMVLKTVNPKISGVIPLAFSSEPVSYFAIKISFLFLKLGELRKNYMSNRRNELLRE
jgi:hypothetical protein